MIRTWPPGAKTCLGRKDPDIAQSLGVKGEVGAGRASSSGPTTNDRKWGKLDSEGSVPFSRVLYRRLQDSF